MPNRKSKKPALKRRTTNSDTQVNFTFFNSKLFVSLMAIALIVIAFAVISSINSEGNNVGQDSYRIDTTNLKNDPSANQVKIPQK